MLAHPARRKSNAALPTAWSEAAGRFGRAHPWPISWAPPIPDGDMQALLTAAKRERDAGFGDVTSVSGNRNIQLGARIDF